MHAPHSLDDSVIEHIATRLIDCTLPATEWTHVAHFAAALWLLRNRPGFGAAAMAPLIQRYNITIGNQNTDTQGYHETITRASLAGAAAALRAQPNAALPTVLDRLLTGPLGKPDWLLVHWSHEVLFSPEARRHWCPPDRAPLPFPI